MIIHLVSYIILLFLVLELTDQDIGRKIDFYVESMGRLDTLTQVFKNITFSSEHTLLLESFCKIVSSDIFISTGSSLALVLAFLPSSSPILFEENKKNIVEYIKDKDLNNIDVISDENMKKEILSNSIFAVCKSGTISLQVCNANVPSIIIYKLNFINFMIFKLLVNVKFANIINIINNKEVIPELLQSECNAKEIYNSVLYMLKNPEIGKKQLEQCNQTLKGIRSNSSSSNEVATILRNSLVG